MNDVIYEVAVSDGCRQYFEHKSEADFYHDDTAKAGFGVRTQPIPIPKTAKQFVGFMERIENDMRPLRKAVENCEHMHNA